MGTVIPPPPWANSVTYSYANNDSTSAQMCEDRHLYDLFVFPEEAVPDYIDFWGKDKAYGKVNTEGVAIVPRENFLAQLENADGTLFALNFVADAWGDFSRRIAELVSEGVLYEDSPYAQPVALKAWTSMDTAYHDYISYDVYAAFVEYVSLAERDSALYDIGDFLHLYYDFSTVIAKGGGPVTLSGYAESVYNSPLSTGLVIEISDVGHDQDFEKGKDFINDPNFLTVVGIAQQYGFLVDKNAPWRFVADIYSRAMFEYMVGIRPLYGSGLRGNPQDCDEVTRRFTSPSQAWGYSKVLGMGAVRRHAFGYPEYQEKLGREWGRFPTQRYLQRIFEVSFRETWEIDMTRLRTYLYDTYERFRVTSPVIVQASKAGEDCKVENKLTPRVAAPPNTFNPESGTYGYLWNLKSYYLLRHLEKGTLPSVQVRKREIQSVVTYYFGALGASPPATAYYNALRMIQNKYIGPIAPVGPIESPTSPFNILGTSPYTKRKESS
jgi:hypothetical protein